MVFSHEGRTWFTSHRGRLWIASTAKKPSQEDIERVETFYKHLKGGKCKHTYFNKDKLTLVFCGILYLFYSNLSFAFLISKNTLTLNFNNEFR